MRRGASCAAAVVLALVARAATSGDPPIAAPVPDFAFYVLRTAPWLDRHCAACHRASGAGSFQLLATGAGAAGTKAERLTQRRAEFESVRRMLDPEAPWRSRLLAKVVGEEEGGLPHAGGTFLRTDDDAYDDLLDFASGATLANFPPEPEPGRDRRAAIGEEVALDGSKSYDRDDDSLGYRWELFARPAGSRAGLSADREAKTSIRPDVGGTYVARLRVFDGKMWSAARPVVVEALERTGPVAPDAIAASGLESIDGRALARVRSAYGDVLGRPPTPPEAILHARKDPREVAGILLRTIEAGRAFVEDAAFRLGLVGDFEPVSHEVQSLPFRLASGETSPAQAEAAFVRDPSFVRAHPPGPALARAVATLLYERDASTEPVASWTDARGLAGVVASTEFAAAALRRLARRFLAAADADAVPLSRAGESTFALGLSFVSSSAWSGARDVRRSADDLAFVRAAYADLLGRRPSSGEAAALARAAGVIPRSGAGRAAVVAVLLDSGEVALPLIVDIPDPAAWLADRFLRTLGRRPGAEEAKVYASALADPAGGPHVVVRALLTSAEYASR